MGDLNPMWYFRGVPEVDVVSVRDCGTQTEPVGPPVSAVSERPWVATAALLFAMVLVRVLP